MFLSVLRGGASRCCAILCYILLPLIVSAFFTPVIAAPPTARSLGDFNQVAVIEVTGNFDALEPSGQVNGEARRALAREFYRSHGDDYDFLVFITNFEVRMPTPKAKAFFSPARNNVEGIGLPIYDHTGAYTADGQPLERLEGTIDMGHVAAHVLEPADPRFETTLRILAHEMLHRWGAYVRFLDGEGEADALLGLDRAHWSFLLDSGGSTLYGNQWQDNGDGTFTALTPESAPAGELFGRLFNPLELYLMGFIDPTSVPPLRLVDAPGIDSAQLPAPGVTIPGIMRTVTIDDIIAYEGPRIPAAAESRKELRMGFVFAVTPGSFSAETPADIDSLTAIGRLRGEWEKRFAILTDGRGRMQTGLVRAPHSESNPAVPDLSEGQVAAASIDAGVAWLIGQQFADGRWQDYPGTALRDTAEALRALSLFPSAVAAVGKGEAWLHQQQAANHDFMARQLMVATAGEYERLLTEVNDDGGWGGHPGFASNPLDTALAMQALAAQGISGAPLAAACSYLHASQLADGGWNAGSGPSQLQPTCVALQALNAQRAVMALETPVAEAGSWLATAQNSDGGFGRPLSTAVDTALALLALKSSGTLPAAVQPALTWLLEHQVESGSWHGRAHATALALQALHAGQMAPDLAVSGADIVVDPPSLTELPGEVTLTVTIRNLGSAPVDAAALALYVGNSLAAANLVAVQSVAVVGNGSAQATFVVPIVDRGVHRFSVWIDAGKEIAESDEWNNIASKYLTANLPPPVVTFASSASEAAESSGSQPLSVVLSHPWHEAITLGYAAEAGGSAVAGADFLEPAGTLSIPAGETMAVIPLELIDDQIAEADETLSLVLSTASGGTIGQGRHLLTILDDEPPLLSIGSPLPATTGDPAPLLLFTSSAANVHVSLDGVPVDIRSGERLGPLGDGWHRLEIVAANRMEISSRQQVDFFVDTSLPVIVIHSPASGTSGETSPLLAFTVEGAVGYRLSLDGSPLAMNSGDRLAALADGDHVLTVTAWNARGDETTATQRFVIDSSPPLVDIFYPLNDVLREASPVLFCRVEGAVASEVRLDSVPIATGCGGRLGPLADGAHVLEVAATDEVGNQTVKRANFIVYTGTEPAYAPVSGWSKHAARYYGGLAVDVDGNVYLATQDSGYALTVQKYSAAGALLWQQRPFAWSLTPMDAAVDAAGNLFVVGYDGSGDGFLYKFASADGTYLAQQTFATAGSDFAVAVQVAGDGQVVVAGETGGNLYGAANGTMNVWLARLDNNCRLLNGRQLTRSGTQELGGRGNLALDHEGNAYLAGLTDSATFGPALGGDDAFVVKFDQNLWPVAPLLQFGTSGNDQALDVAVDVYGHIYVGGVSVETSHFFETGFVYKFDAAGTFRGQIAVGSQPLNALTCERDGTLYALDDNGVLRKYDRDLSLLWNLELGWNYRHQLAKDAFGSLYAAGDGGTTGNYARVVKIADSRRPSVTLDAAQIQTRYDSVVLGGTLSNGAIIELLNPELRQSGPVLYPSPGRWQMTVAGLPAGSTSVLLQVTATTGFTRQIAAAVTVDVTPPLVVIEAPADAQHCTVKPILVYSVSDGKVEVLVNGVAVYKSSGQPLDALRSGWNTVRVEATDPAGNTGSATIRIFAQGEAVGEPPLSQGTVAQAGTSDDDSVVAVARDSAGNLFLMGHTSGSFPGYVNAGSRDPYVAKFDSTGRHLVTWQFGSILDESGGGLAIDASDNLLMAWNVRYVNNKGQIDYGVRLTKMSANGTFVWQAELNSSANDQVFDLTLTASGDVLIGGETYGNLDRQRYGGAGDYFLAKFSATGSKQWVRLSNSAANEAIYGIVTDGTGAIYAAAMSGGPLAGVAVPEHVALLKFDAAGNLLRAEPIRLPGSDYIVRKLLRDADGRLLTAGANGTRYFLAAHDTSLSGQWLTVSLAEESLQLSAVALDASGNLYVGGQVTGAFAGNRAFGASDGVLVKHAATGVRQWSLQYGSYGNDYVTGMLWDTGGWLWLGGHTDGLLGETRQGQLDAYLLRLDRPEPLTGPALSLDPYPRMINTTAVNLSGATTPGAVLSVESATPEPLAAVQVDETGRWQATVSGLPANAEQLLTITASNELGTSSLAVTITVDTLPPLLTVAPPLTPTPVPWQMLSGTVEVGANLKVLFAAFAGDVSTADGLWSQRIEGLSAGDNLMTLIATDAAGNSTTREVSIRYLPPPPPMVTVAPAVIEANHATDIVLTIDQIVPSGGTVTVFRVLDLNGNGHAESNEPLIDGFSVTDGVLPAHLGVPADSDGAENGVISVLLNGHFVKDRLHAPGEYLYVVTTTGGSAVTGFSVLDRVGTQSISGTVRDQAGEPVAGALIELSDAWQHSHGFALSDQMGRYRFSDVAPGDYLVWAGAPGHVSPRLPSPAVHLVSGECVQADLLLQRGVYAVSGRVHDAVTAQGLAGVRVTARSDDSLAVAVTGADGDYRLGLLPGSYQLALSGAYGDGLAEAGYLAKSPPLPPVTVTADMSGVDLAADRGSVLICGQVRTAAGASVGGVPVEATHAATGRLNQAISSGNGRYCLGIDGGDGWALGHPDRLAFASGWLGGRGLNPDNTALTVFPLDARVGGVVVDAEGRGAAGIPLTVSHVGGAAMAGATSTDGSYRLGLSSELSGEWSLVADAQGLGYLPVTAAVTALPGGEVLKVMTLQRPSPENTITITKAGYDVRKKTLSVEATSLYPEAQLRVVDYGAMSYVRLFKGKYYWSLVQSVAAKPASVTVTGPEGSVTAPVQ